MVCCMKSMVDAEVIDEVLEVRDEVVDDEEEEPIGRRKPVLKVLGLEICED